MLHEHAGISPGMLSRLETGHVNPSLETIVALAEALGVRPALLLQEVGEYEGGAQHVPDGEGLEVVRRGTKRGHTYHLLAAQRGRSKVFEPFLVTLTDKSEIFPGIPARRHRVHPHTVRGNPLPARKESILLKEGDSLTFRGDVAHGPERLVKVPISDALGHHLRRESTITAPKCGELALPGGVKSGRRPAIRGRQPTSGRGKLLA